MLAFTSFLSIMIWSTFMIAFREGVRASPFTAEPPSLVYVQENSTTELVWEIENCGWEVRIVTEKYTLHPNIDPTRVPIKIHTDYNVSITPEVCKENTMNTNVTLSIKFTESVLEHAKYIVCKVFRYDESLHKSRVNFKLATTAQTTGETTATMITIMPSISIIIPTKLDEDDNNNVLPTIETTINSGSDSTVHFSNCCASPLCMIIYLLFAFLLYQ